MYDAGVYGAERALMLSALTSHHFIRNRVYLLDKSRRYIADLSNLMIDGVVDMDADASTTRSAKVSLIDPARTMGIDFGNVAAGPQYYNYLIQVVHEFQRMDRTRWFGIPMMTGPVTNFKRDDIRCEVEVSGMEAFCQNGNLYPWTASVGNGKVAIIRHLLQVHAGETLFDITAADNASTIMQTPWSLEPGDDVWEKLRELADSIGCRLFYNANGVACLRPKNYGSMFTLDTSWLVDKPDVDFDHKKMRNIVIVEGGIPPGGDRNIRTEVALSPAHPYSPQSLGRNGVPMFLPEFIKDDNIKTIAEANAAANYRLMDVSLSSLSLTANSSINPLIEENDIITIAHPEAWAQFMCAKWSIPLRGNTMSVGTHATTSRGSYASTSRLVSSGLNPSRLLNHGPSGAFNTLGGRGGKKGPKYGGQNPGVSWSTNKGRDKNKNRNKNRNRKGGKK